MKLLYVASGHPLQNADDCLMWDKLGIDWVDTGYYSQSEQPGDLPYIQRRCPELYEELKHQQGNTHPDDGPNTLNYHKNVKWTGTSCNNHWLFTKRFIDKFDVIFFNHFPETIFDNLEVIKGKTVILKTYGMHGNLREHQIRRLRNKHGVLIVRNNPTERLLFGEIYAGHDAVIRGSVVRDEYEMSGWRGDTLGVCTFASFCDNITSRSNTLGSIRGMLSSLGRFHSLFGIGNRTFDPQSDFVTHDEKLEILRSYRVNLVIGTPGASNTYSFVEAWLMGQPVVAFGPSLWGSSNCEMPILIDNEINGFYSNSVPELVSICSQLLKNKALAQQISTAARTKAVGIFGRDVLCEQWRKLLYG